MIREFVNNLYVPNNNWHVQDPYFYVRVDSFDNADIIEENIIDWSANDVLEYPSGVFVGLSRNDSSSSVTFTRTVNLPKTGKYMFEIFGKKRPQCSGDMTLTVDGTTVLTENMNNGWDDYGTWIQSDIVDITDDGTCVLALTVPKQSFVAHFRIVPITRYEGGREYNGPSETRLDILNIEFTTNGVNEVDKGKITVAFKEDFYTDDNPYSILCFDAWDPVTIVVGEDMQSAIPMFGGYVSGWSLNDECTELTIDIIDSIYRLSRVFLWKNFSIGYIPENTTGRMPFTQFPNVNEIARYICTSDYPINFEAITRDYIFYHNFATEDTVTQLTNSGWKIDWQPEFGNPAPCMRLRPNQLGESSVILYSSSIGEWDATVYNFFNFDYYVSGAGIIFPPRFNIEIDMYKNGQTPSQSITYTIPFTGPNPGGLVLDPILPRFDGTWNSFLVDLKAQFDKKAPSTHYYISEIRIVGQPDQQQILNNKCTSVYIDHIIGYRDFQSAPRYASADSKTPLQELQDLCDKTNQISFIRPAMARKDDQLIMIPKRFYTLPLEINEGSNLIDVSGLTYKPIEWGLKNYTYRTFNYDDSRSGSITKQDMDSILWYNRCMDHEFVSDVKNDMDAAVDAQYFVDEHKFWYPAFDVTVLGTTLLEPGQYINVSIPSKRITGPQEVQSLKFKLDTVNRYFTTTVSFNAPHRSFMQFMRIAMKTQQALKNLGNNAAYRSFGNQEAGLNTSSAAFRQN